LALMPVDPLQRLDGHPQVSGGFPDISAVLHQPRGGRVPQRCGVTSLSRPASRTALRNALSQSLTGLPFHSTTNRCPRRFQRLRCASYLSGNGTGGCCFFVFLRPLGRR
jgi:hypothetical protein